MDFTKILVPTRLGKRKKLLIIQQLDKAPLLVKIAMKGIGKRYLGGDGGN